MAYLDKMLEFVVDEQGYVTESGQFRVMTYQITNSVSTGNEEHDKSLRVGQHQCYLSLKETAEAIVEQSKFYQSIGGSGAISLTNHSRETGILFDGETQISYRRALDKDDMESLTREVMYAFKEK